MFMQANRGQTNTTLGWIPTVVLLFGCTSSDTTPRVAEIEFPAALTYELMAVEDAPLGPMDFVVSEDSAVLVYDRPTHGLWRFSTDTAAGFQRIGAKEWPGMKGVMAVGGNADTIGVIDAAWMFGTMAVNGDAEPRLTRIQAGPPGRVIGLYRLASRAWVVVEERGSFRQEVGHPLDSVLVQEIAEDGALVPLFGFEKTGPVRPTTLLTDYVSARASGDSLWIAGAAPPRIYRWVYSETALSDSLALDGAPKRAIPAEEQRQTARNLKAVPTFSDAEVPTFYPPVAKSWSYGSGTLVVGGAEDSFALDLYCAGRFRGTLADSPDVVAIALTRDGAWVQLAAQDGSSVSLNFASAMSLTAGCSGR
jgi:hypothetical protein